MTQPTLDFTAAPTSLNEKLAAYFKARPDVWIDGHALSKVAGFFAFRSRISDLRRAPFNMTVENKQRRISTPTGKYTESHYRYVSQPEQAEGNSVQCVLVQHGEATRP